MKNNIVKIAQALTLAGSLFGSMAFASSLEGNWKYVRKECSSGAKPVSAADFETSVSGVAIITHDQINAKLRIRTKTSQTFAEQNMKQNEATLAQLEQQPESPDNQKTIEEIKKEIANMKKYEVGVECTSSAVLSYSVKGTNLHSKTLSLKSTCEDSTSSDEDDTTFEVKGNTLRLTESQTEEAGPCPKGDQEVSIFRRIK